MFAVVLVSTSSVLIGVHGQAIGAHLPFLAASQRRVALVEIIPRTYVHFSYLRIMAQLSKALGVNHTSVIAPLDLSSISCLPNAPKNHGGGPLRCNVTIKLQEFMPLVHAAAEYTSTSEERAGGANGGLEQLSSNSTVADRDWEHGKQRFKFKRGLPSEPSPRRSHMRAGHFSRRVLSR